MPEDLPKAVMILLWLLIGIIVLGYLVMAHPLYYSLLFAVIYYGGAVLWYVNRKDKEG